MKETTLTMPELAMIGGTRVALGAGIGFLLADKLSSEQRRAAGIVLLLVGAISTVPLALEVLGKGERWGSDGPLKDGKTMSDKIERRKDVNPGKGEHK